MKRDIIRIYDDALAFTLACPLLFMVPVMVMLGQHGVEMLTGLYDSVAAAQQVGAHPLRIVTGFAASLALLLPGYWFVRYTLSDRNAAYAKQWQGKAVGLWLIQLALLSAYQAFVFFAPPLSALVWLDGQSEATLTLVELAPPLAMLVLTLLGAAWAAAWPLGNAAIGPLRSIRLMMPFAARALLYLVAGTVPLMALRLGLSVVAVGQPAWLAWPMLVLDAVLFGLLALTLSGATAIVAERAAAARDVSLFPATL